MGMYNYIQETDTAVSHYDVVESRDGMLSEEQKGYHVFFISLAMVKITYLDSC